MASLPPEPIHLRDQIADHLRDRLRSGEWPEFLPSERYLMRALDVSRLTVRFALQALEGEGLLQSEGKRRRVLEGSRGTRTKTGGGKTEVVVLSSRALEEVMYSHVVVFDMLREKLGRHGFSMEVLISPRFEMTRRGQEFAEIVANHPDACFLLIRIPSAGQDWFARHAPHSLVLGSTGEDKRLPSFDIDFDATCFHAASMLAGRRKRRLAFVRRASDLVGDSLSENGLRRACKQFGCEAIVHRLPGEPASVIDWLQALRRDRCLPDGIIASDPAIYLSIFSFCHAAKLSIPEEIALVCRGDDPLLDAVRPGVARYRINDNAYINRLWNCLLPILRGQSVDAHAELVFPDYVPGDSVGYPVVH